MTYRLTYQAALYLPLYLPVACGRLSASRRAYDYPVNFATIRDLAACGATGPMRVLKTLGRMIGRPLADLCTFLNPSALLLDASLGAAAMPIADGIRDQIEAYAALQWLPQFES